MKSGLIQLDKLYDYSKTTSGKLPIDGRSESSRLFSGLVKEVTKPIPKAQGVYLWGNYNQKGVWSNIYVGKSDKRKHANLNTRITDELKEERLFFWSDDYLTDDEAVEDALRLYPTVGPKSKAHYERSIRKQGTTHIVWVSLPDMYIPAKVEDCLIEIMNPIANVKSEKPNNDLLNISIEVIKEFKHHIDAQRF